MSVEAGIGVTTFNITEEAIRGYSMRQDGQTQSKLGYSGNINMKFFRRAMRSKTVIISRTPWAIGITRKISTQPHQQV
jgi:hypothetical protein